MRQIGEESTTDAVMTLFACVNSKCWGERWSVCFWKLCEVSHIPTLMNPARVRVHVAETEHNQTDGWLQFSEQVAASGKEQCSNFFKISSRFCRTFSFDYTPSERCYLISAYSHVLYYSMLLELRCEKKQFLQHQKKKLIKTLLFLVFSSHLGL